MNDPEHITISSSFCLNDSKDIDGNGDADCWYLGFRVLLEEECCGDVDDTVHSRQEKCRTGRSFCDADDAVHSGQEKCRTERSFCKPKYI